MYTRTYHYHTHVKTSCIILMRTYTPVYTYIYIYISMYVYFDAPFVHAMIERKKVFFARFTFRLQLIHKLFQDPKRGGEQRHTHTRRHKGSKRYKERTAVFSSRPALVRVLLISLSRDNATFRSRSTRRELNYLPLRVARSSRTHPLRESPRRASYLLLRRSVHGHRLRRFHRCREIRLE
jgi:hypothetical protein